MKEQEPQRKASKRRNGSHRRLIEHLLEEQMDREAQEWMKRVKEDPLKWPVQ